MNNVPHYSLVPNSFKKEREIISCSSCDSPLLDLLVNQTGEIIEWKIVAHCPFCQDRSFIKVINGIFSYSGIEPSETDSTKKVMNTKVKSISYEEEVLHVYLGK